MLFNKIVGFRTIGFLIFLFGISFGCIGYSQELEKQKCSLEMSRHAETLLIDARDDWASLLKHQRVFASCDDGTLGEGYSDAVVQLFAQKWRLFGVFSRLAKKHPAFESWAVQHIDGTASDDSLHKIIINTSACVNSIAMKSLCMTIQSRAENALKESTQMGR